MERYIEQRLLQYKIPELIIMLGYYKEKSKKDTLYKKRVEWVEEIIKMKTDFLFN